MALNPNGSERSFPDPFNRRQGSTRNHREGTFADIETIALDSADLGPDRRTRTRDVYLAGRTLPYSVVFLTDGPHPDWHREKFLYQLRRQFQASQPFHPAPDDLALAPPHFHPYLKDQWFHVSLEGGGFVAIDAPNHEFFRNGLPGHLRTEYFRLFLMALQQRFSLMGLSADVARHWESDPRRQSRRELRDSFVRIRDRLFDFTARYHFLQVVQRENHHRFYQLWRERFQTDELYREVSEEVRELSEYLQDRERQAWDRRIALLTVFVAAPSVAIGFWGININGVTAEKDGFSLWEAVGHVAGLAVGIGAVFAIIWAAFRRR